MTQGKRSVGPRSPELAIWRRLLDSGASADEAAELMNGYAHGIAERQRAYSNAEPGEPGCWHDGVNAAANLIDPKAQRAATKEEPMPGRKSILINAPSEAVILAARHLEATEGRVQIGSTVDASTRSAITTVLDYIAKAHNSPAVDAPTIPEETP